MIKYRIKMIAAGIVALFGIDAFAEPVGFESLPIEMVHEVSKHLPLADAKNRRLVNHFVNGGVELNKTGRIFDRAEFLEKLEKIERLLELEQYIPLTESKSSYGKLWNRLRNKAQNLISHIGISQELWVEVMGNNPSHFKEQRYCPATHRSIQVSKRNGEIEKIELCPELPVEMVQARNDHERNSDEEFIARLNLAFKLAGRDIKFRRATAKEYIWADSEGGKNPKQENDPDLWKYATWYSISNKDPARDPDDNILLASGEHQPHGVKAKNKNGFGFYRSGVWEWTDNMLGLDLVGGSWSSGPENAVSGIRGGYWPSYYWYLSIGPARLVRTQ